MSIELFYHPFSRAASAVWMLEEVGCGYEIRFVDLMKGAHKSEDITHLNPMGKLPILKDGDAVVTESAAIGLYLADRYSSGTLAPALDDPQRASYLRWSLFAPSVIEPGCMAKSSSWKFEEGSAGWGNYQAMVNAMETALKGDYILGEHFSMADVIFGGTVRFMLQFDMLEKRDSFVAYSERLAKRPALQKANDINQRLASEHKLQVGK